MLWDNLEGWDGVGGGREVQEGGSTCIFMADSRCCIQKPTQHCKAIVLQLKKKAFLNNQCVQDKNIKMVTIQNTM